MFHKLLFSFSLLAVLLSSCEKDIGILGMGVMPSEDILAVRLDSLSNFNFKYLKDNTNDTIRTTQYSLLLGSYTDPVFGNVRAEIFAPLFFNNPVIDTSLYKFELVEADLLLTYNDTSFQYGKNIPQTIIVSEFTDSIDFANYKTLEFKPRETPIGNYTLKIDTTVESDSIITLKLPNTFLKKIDTYIRTSKYSIDMEPDTINKVWGRKFYGLHLKTKFDDASVIKLKDIAVNLKVKRTSIADASIVDTTSQELILSDFIDEDTYIYRHPLVRFELKPTKTITENIGKPNQKKIYIQPMKGYKADFLFPDLDRWRDSSKVVINIAQLTIPIEKSSLYSAIPKLTLNIYLNGIASPIATYTSQDIDDNDKYVFYMNSFMTIFMKYQKSANEYRYEIVAPNNNLYVNRSILLPENAKLHLTYTKYK